MKVENELKYRIKNVNKIKKKLLNLNFSFKKEVSQKDYYFSPPHKSFAGTKKYYLRLRRKEQGGDFEYHIVLNNLQTKEWAVKINNFNTLLKILALLDFKIDCIISKKRLIYKKGNIKIMIDKVNALGNFIEIEYYGKFTARIEKNFHSLINSLMLKKNDLVKGIGYPDLLMDRKLDKKT